MTKKQIWGIVVSHTSKWWHLTILLSQVAKGEGIVYYLYTPTLKSSLIQVSNCELFKNYTGTVFATHYQSTNVPQKNSSCMNFWSHYFKSAVYISNRNLPTLLIWTSISSICSTFRATHPYKPVIVSGYTIKKIHIKWWNRSDPPCTHYWISWDKTKNALDFIDNTTFSQNNYYK